MCWLRPGVCSRRLWWERKAGEGVPSAGRRNSFRSNSPRVVAVLLGQHAGDSWKAVFRLHVYLVPNCCRSHSLPTCITLLSVALCRSRSIGRLPIVLHQKFHHFPITQHSCPATHEDKYPLPRIRLCRTRRQRGTVHPVLNLLACNEGIFDYGSRCHDICNTASPTGRGPPRRLLRS